MNRSKVSRRTFLKTLLCSSIALKLGSRQHPLKSQSTSIIVIGAGASGLAAAYMLTDEGYNVTVLEARNRVGGRAFSDYSLAPYPIEMGAEFIHGDGVVTWDVMAEFDMDSLDQNEYNTMIHIDNTIMTADEFTDEYEVDVESVLDTLIAEWLDEGNDDISIQGLLEDALDSVELAAYSELIRLLDTISATDNGGNIGEVGISGLASSGSEDAGNGDFRLEDGYSVLMNAIAEELDVQLEMPVQQIEWGTSGIRITTDNGEQFEADKLIVTLPLGVLKSNQVTFLPSLPLAKQNAINMLGAGHVDKVILKFDEAFWVDEFEIIVTTLNTQSWWRPGIGRDDELPILTALVGGDDAIRYEGMTNDEVIAANIQQLEQIWGVDNLADHVVDAKFIAWGTDPYSQMGYSFVPVDGVGLNDALGESIDDVLFFAGEATHSTHFGTVHGALESGFRAAEEVIEAI